MLSVDPVHFISPSILPMYVYLNYNAYSALHSANCVLHIPSYVFYLSSTLSINPVHTISPVYSIYAT